MGLPRQADPRIAYGDHVTGAEASQRGIGEACAVRAVCTWSAVRRRRSMRAPVLISRHLSARHRELFVDDPYVPLIDGRLFLEGTHIRVRQGGLSRLRFSDW